MHAAPTITRLIAVVLIWSPEKLTLNMFDIIFSSILLRLFHTVPSVLFIILQRRSFSFTSAPHLHLQITLSPFLPSCYHSCCLLSSPDTLPPPHTHPSRLFLGSLPAPLFLVSHTHVIRRACLIHSFLHLCLSDHLFFLLAHSMLSMLPCFSLSSIAFCSSPTLIFSF